MQPTQSGFCRSDVLTGSTRPRRRPLPTLWVVATVVVSMMAFSGVKAQSGDSITVDVGPGESIRDIAAQYLGDADLWREILRANGLRSVTDVAVGTRLTVPVGLITRANEALDEATEQIQLANAAGARLFAGDTVARAIGLRDDALERRTASDWEGSAATAQDAAAVGREALAETMAQRRADAEAVLAARRGNVEQRRSDELVWNEASLNAVLVKEERIRTLSRSTCQIRFLDESRLRLGQNSQAVIRTLEIDRLTKDGEASVSLVEGDVHALLGGNRKKRRFTLDVPGVQTEFESTNFWVSRDAETSKFANYDDGSATITSEGRTVTLRKNEGTQVGQTVQIAVRRLLDAPSLQSPPDDASLSQEDVQLTWALVVGAGAFWVEVATDQRFDHTVATRRDVETNSFMVIGLDDGMYYWRVSALDDLGLPGPKSPIQRFAVRADAYAPYLVVESPADGTIVREAALQVAGVTETGVTVQVGGRAVAVSADGRFVATYQLTPGVNEVALEARDAANHVTRRTRSVILMPDTPARIEYGPTLPRLGPRQFLASDRTFTLAGTTSAVTSLLQVQGRDGGTRVTAYSNELGAFLMNVALVDEEETFALRVTAPSGFVTQDTFTVTVDRESPGLTVDALPPRGTRESTLRLSGLVREASVLRVNGESAALAGGRFAQTIVLQDGANALEVLAADPVGYVSLARWTVLLDRDAPELVSQRVRQTEISTGTVLEVEVRARDASDMQHVARVELRGGGVRRSAVLQLDPASATYRGVVYLADDVAGVVALRSVSLEDYLGNSRLYTIE